MNYERVVQWLAGPTSALTGWLATQIVNHWHIFGSLGIGHSPVAQAIFNSSVFGSATVASLVAHHKWLSNLVQWWNHAGVATPADEMALPDSVTPLPPAEDTVTLASPPPEQEADRLRAQLKAAGIPPAA